MNFLSKKVNQECLNFKLNMNTEYINFVKQQSWNITCLNIFQQEKLKFSLFNKEGISTFFQQITLTNWCVKARKNMDCYSLENTLTTIHLLSHFQF